MNDKYIRGTEDLLNLFLDEISASDVLSAKVLSEISSTIVRNRINLGMTQKDFAEHMDVSQSMVSKWESSDYNFSVKSLADIAEKLDLDLKIKLQKKRVIEISKNIREYSVISSTENNFYVISLVDSNNSTKPGKVRKGYEWIKREKEDFYPIYKEG